MSPAFYGLTASQVDDIGRALWQTWRAIGSRTLREHGVPTVPAIVAVELCVPRVWQHGGQVGRGTLAFITNQHSFAVLEVARAAGYFKSDNIGKA